MSKEKMHTGARWGIGVLLAGTGIIVGLEENPSFAIAILVSLGIAVSGIGALPPIGDQPGDWEDSKRSLTTARFLGGESLVAGLIAGLTWWAANSSTFMVAIGIGAGIVGIGVIALILLASRKSPRSVSSKSASGAAAPSAGPAKVAASQSTPQTQSATSASSP